MHFTCTTCTLPEFGLGLPPLNPGHPFPLQEPQHPYSLRTRITERAHDRLPGVRVASLYDTVERLAAAGLIQAGEPDPAALARAARAR